MGGLLALCVAVGLFGVSVAKGPVVKEKKGRGKGKRR